MCLCVCVNVTFIHEIKTVIHLKNRFKIIFIDIKLCLKQNNVVTETSQLLSNLIYIHQHQNSGQASTEEAKQPKNTCISHSTSTCLIYSCTYGNTPTQT